MKNSEYVFIKPNRRVHDSGYRCFTTCIGTMRNDNKVTVTKELGIYSDHIEVDLSGSDYNRVNFDMTRDGYIRPFINDKDKRLVWRNEEFNVSSATIVVVKR